MHFASDDNRDLLSLYGGVHLSGTGEPPQVESPESPLGGPSGWAPRCGEGFGVPTCSAPHLSPSLPPPLPAKDADKSQDCALPVEEAGIIWDSICFVFLLLQRRVFLSYYFLHAWADLKASALQASR